MHYYQFNIGDYASRTAHLEPLEDLAYRRMIDLYVKTESPLPEIQEIARLIRMRSHAECIKSVLRDFFVKTDEGYVDSYIQEIVDKFKDKAEKAKRSAQARWNKESSSHGENDDANAMRTQCDRYANHKPITNNHKPITNNQESNIKRIPTLEQVKAYAQEKKYTFDVEYFYNYWESSGWTRGKQKIKSWKACMANLQKKHDEFTRQDDKPKPRKSALEGL